MTIFSAAEVDEVMREQTAYLLWHSRQACDVPRCPACKRFIALRRLLLEPYRTVLYGDGDEERGKAA